LTSTPSPSWPSPTWTWPSSRDGFNETQFRPKRFGTIFFLVWQIEFHLKLQSKIYLTEMDTFLVLKAIHLNISEKRRRLRRQFTSKHLLLSDKKWTYNYKKYIWPFLS
jgi:hypothetical protein